MKPLVIVLSLGFAVLGLIGIVSGITLWLSWLDLIAGVLGVIASFSIGTEREAGESYVSFAEGICSGVLWIIALATHHGHWLSWWTFAFAIAFLLVGFVGGYSTQRGVHLPA